MSVIELVAGDTGSKIVVTCKENQTRAAIDLTGATVKLRYSISGGVVQVKTMTILTPATDGKAEYRFLTGELTQGNMRCEVEITDINARIITQLDPFILTIRAKV